MRIRFSIAILIFFSSNLLLSQVTGEWILEDYVESEAYDLSMTEDGIYVLIRTLNDIDTDQYDFKTDIIKLSFDPEDDKLDVINIYSRNDNSNGFLPGRLNKVRNNWLYTESTFTNPMQDTFYLNRFDNDFEFIERVAHPIHAGLINFCSVVYGNDSYAGIGSIFDPPDSLVGVSYSADAPNSTLIKVFLTQPAPSISFVTSMTYDFTRARFLVFHLGGISHLNDTLGLIHRYPGNQIHTAQHGTILSQDFRYYSFGANANQGSPDLRDLVFQQYDTSMQIMFADTFGRQGKDDYPFTNRSLDFMDNHFYVGGMLAGPLEILQQYPLKFFLAKYDQNLDKVWYREYGGSHNYVIRGLTGLPDGRCLVYGYRVDNSDGLRYPYLLIVNEDGQISSSKDIQKPEPQLFQILYTTESENITISASQEIDELQLFSLDGKSIARYQNILPGTHDFNLAYLPPGVYVFLATSGKERQSGKWVKR